MCDMSHGACSLRVYALRYAETHRGVRMCEMSHGACCVCDTRHGVACEFVRRRVQTHSFHTHTSSRQASCSIYFKFAYTLQHTATHCNTLRHPATYCCF